VWCEARKVLNGDPATVGHWRVVRELPAASAAPAATPAGDPYGFGAMLNAYRASAGLSAVAYDPGLSAWAAQNNAAQQTRGLGHHINPGMLQNAGMGYATVQAAFAGWRGSPGHNAAMLARVTSYGIHRLGIWWTLNLR